MQPHTNQDTPETSNAILPGMLLQFRKPNRQAQSTRSNKRSARDNLLREGPHRMPEFQL